ncbi:HD-GYP domain-containing protein [Luteipulveratus halotolerans]|uniref:HD-GYP domain-containing protein n=1 Tax=Luteipulveratus halotolerans TaxID=1631356 RepID=UPI0012FAB7F3|nr:HD domain-containing phosphohydrolase [Luteipulveratus halotolerans]
MSRLGRNLFVVKMSRLLSFVAVALVGGFAVASLFRIPDLSAQDYWALFAFFGAAYVGELLRLRGLGARGISPVAVSATYAAALATEVPAGRLTFGAPEVMLVSCAALVAGVISSKVITGMTASVDVMPYVARLLALLVLAVGFRSVPFSEDGAVAGLTFWRGDQWRLAAGMLLSVMLAHLVELLLQVALRSCRTRQRVKHVLQEDFREMVPASMAALSTAVVIALGMRSLGLVAIPLFMVPLVLMRFAMQQEERINAARIQTVAALSQMTDLAGYTEAGHARRVALLCSRVGTAMRLTEEQLGALESATLLHDIGQVSLGAPIPAGATVDAAPRDQQRIADEGAAIAAQAGATEQVVNIIEQQAMPFRRLVEEGEPLTMPARILKVCNAYDDFSHGDPTKHDNAILRLRLGLGYEYDPEVVEALARVIAGDEVAAAVQ